MNKKNHVIVIGAGPGGLACAMLLANRGFKVTVLEKNSKVGGRSSAISENGFTFDTGPTLLMMKPILDDLFKSTHRDSDSLLEFIKMDPLYSLIFNDKKVRVYSDQSKMRMEMKRHFPEGDQGLDSFLKEEKERFEKIYPCMQKDYSKLSDLWSPEMLRALPYVSITKNVFQNLGRYFKNDHLKLTFSFQSKYLGMSPWKCPALFTILPYIEHSYGIYHVTGGLNQINEAFANAIHEDGGKIYLNATVQSLIIEKDTFKGVVLENGERLYADDVILNADFGYAMSSLFPKGYLKKYTPKKLNKMEYSCSTFMLYLGLDKVYKDLDHHNFMFAEDYHTNTESIFDSKSLVNDFSAYIQNPSVTDPTLAPVGCSSLYVLVTVPNNTSELNWSTIQGEFRNKVIQTLMRRTALKDLDQHIVFEKMTTPRDWELQGNIFKGATFNLAHKFSQLLYFRPRNQFEELEGCYLVGGGTHPGSGLPTIYESARIAANLLFKKRNINSPELVPVKI